MSKKFFASLAGLFVAASSILALNGLNGITHAAVDNTPDCDTVAIIKCGAFSEAELRTDAAKGDVSKVYAAFGITPSELNGFVSGVVWKDGRVTVGDKVVATGALTAGRWNNPKPGMTRIPNTDRAYKMSTSNFVDEGQTAFIKMTNGKFDFAVIKSCGNPVTAKPVTQPKPPTPPPAPKPEYTCVSLTAKPLSGNSPTPGTYEFTATASVKNGAAVSKYRYEFGDGKSEETSDRTVTHTYAPGTYTAKLTVIFTVNGKPIETTGKDCSKIIKVAQPNQPKYECTSLEAELIDQETHRYVYTLDYVAEDGATLKTVDFNFGDGTSLKDVKPEDLSTVEHAYTEAKPYTAIATLHFDVVVGGVVGIAKKTDTCQFRITPEETPVEECKPGIPVGDERCEEQEVEECKPGIPVGDERCEEQPQVLPSTGPAELAVGGVGLSSLAGAGYYWRSSRRNLIKKLLNK